RDEGAFQVIQELFMQAPPYVAQKSPQWHDLYRLKRTWYSIEECTRHGDAALRMKAALLAKHFLSASLDAPDSEKRFDVNEGFVDVGHAVRALTASMPNGARTILERLVSCQALSEYQRGQTLIAYSEALGDETRPVVFRELKQTILRQYAAQAIEKLGKDR